MKTQHTPGQWRVKESGGCVCSPNKTICQLISIDDGVLSITPEVEANSKLIASAPELLEALKLLLQAQYTYYHELDDTEDEKVTQDIKDRAEQAIKKATE